jgi:hypothetical protein
MIRLAMLALLATTALPVAAHAEFGKVTLGTLDVDAGSQLVFVPRTAFDANRRFGDLSVTDTCSAEADLLYAVNELGNTASARPIKSGIQFLPDSTVAGAYVYLQEPAAAACKVTLNGTLTGPPHNEH